MKDRSSLSEAVDTSQYQIADVAFFPAGGQRVLAHAKGSEATRLLQAEVANLLKQCRDFKTIDEHIDDYCREKQVSSIMLETLCHKLRCLLQDLAQEGFLTSSSYIRNLFQGQSHEVAPSPITSIVFPTGNRVEVLQRGMISYLEHCHHFGRTHDFVVMDDSKVPATRDAYRQMLRSLRACYGMNIAYAGFEEKMAFVKKLSEVGDIPTEVVSWACMGDKQYGERTEGANRNALLLHTVGERIFTTDDDVICHVAASPDFREGQALSSRGDPAEFWFYPDRDSALESVQFVEQDILALHEQWLSQDPKACMASYSRGGQLSFEQAKPDFLHRLAARPNRIAVTAHGMVGDGGWLTSDFLFFRSGETFKRLTSSEQAYRSAYVSREMAQVVKQVTITETTYPLIGMCIGGLDNRELLPPFPPVGWAVDLAFGLMLTKCFPHVCSTHLPWVLVHAPLGTRSYPELTFDIPFYDWILVCIGLFDPGLASTPADRLHKLGQFLDEIGHLPTDSFVKFTRQQLWRIRGEGASVWEKYLHNSQEPLPAFWRRDIETYYEQMRRSALLPAEQLLRGGPEIFQRSLVQFALILKWWPAMVETARRLRVEGYYLAQPI